MDIGAKFGTINALMVNLMIIVPFFGYFLQAYTATKRLKSATLFMAMCRVLSSPRRFRRTSSCSAFTITSSKNASTGARRPAKVCKLAVYCPAANCAALSGTMVCRASSRSFSASSANKAGLMWASTAPSASAFFKILPMRLFAAAKAGACGKLAKALTASKRAGISCHAQVVRRR